MGIVRAALPRPDCPHYKEDHQKGEIRIRRFEMQRLRNLCEPGIFPPPQPLAAFRAENTIVRQVGATVPTEHLYLSPFSSHPVSRLEEFQSLRFHRSGFGLEVVNPPHKWRKAHENRLGSSASFQSKDRPAIIEEVELDIPAAPVELIFAFAVSVGQVHPPLCDWQIRVQERVTDVTNKREGLVGITLDIVEENPANTSHFTAMFQHKVFIARFLESRIKLRVVTIARLLDGAMEVDRIFSKGIARSEIRSSAEPCGIAFLQISKVRVDCGHHRAARMKHQRDPGRKKRSAAAQRDLRRELFRQVSMHRRKIDPSFLENLSLLDDSCAAPAPSFARPGVFAKRTAFELFNRMRDPVLQLLEVGLGLFTPTHAGDYIMQVCR